MVEIWVDAVWTNVDTYIFRTAENNNVKTENPGMTFLSQFVPCETKSDEICRDQFPNHPATMFDVLSLDHVSDNKLNSPSAVSLVWCCTLKFGVYGVSHAVVSTILKWLIILPTTKSYMGRSHLGDLHGEGSWPVTSILKSGCDNSVHDWQY